MAKVLIVEDNVALAEPIVDLLRSENHVVEHVADGTEAADRLKFYFYDLVIVDWELPGCSGIDLVKSIRFSGKCCAVLMLTGRTSTGDRVTGLESGADDYLCKPFQMKELLLRIRALLRRPSAEASAAPQQYSLKMNAADYSLSYGKAKMALLPKEFAVVQLLQQNMGSYVSIEQLAGIVWDADPESVSATIRTTIKRVRIKAAQELGLESFIDSVRGSGYKLVDPPAVPE